VAFCRFVTRLRLRLQIPSEGSRVTLALGARSPAGSNLPAISSLRPSVRLLLPPCCGATCMRMQRAFMHLAVCQICICGLRTGSCRFLPSMI
jgi:hypothetical protein